MAAAGFFVPKVTFGDRRHGVTNFASFLRVCCARYLMLQVSGHIPADTSVPIRSLDPDLVLAGEACPAHSPVAPYAVSVGANTR